MDNPETNKETSFEKEKPLIEGDFEISPDKKVSKQEFKEQKKEKETQVAFEEKPQISGQSGVGAPGIDTSQSPLHQSVEEILETGLEDAYFSMDTKTQEKFKKKGEETASKIIQLISTGKATLKKVFKLIFGWLKIIPGVNKYFLEQEAKIKADKILEIDK